MTLREFIQEKEKITAFEIISEIVLNIVVGEEVYGLNVDTSNIQEGIPLIRVNDFYFEEDFIVIDGRILLSLETSLL